MKINQGIVAVIAVLIILAPVGYSVLSAVVGPGAQDGQPFLEKPKNPNPDQPPQCIRDMTYMRFHHMDFLKKLRNDAVRRGIRGEVGFFSCRECHTSKERFCNQCHDAVNLKPDCFRCHYYP